MSTNLLERIRSTKNKKKDNKKTVGIVVVTDIYKVEGKSKEQLQEGIKYIEELRKKYETELAKRVEE